MITTVINTGSTYCNTVYLTGKELVDRRNKLRADAYKFLQENDVDSIVYYHDERDEEGNIEIAYLYYNMIGMDSETLAERTKNINGLVGAVHKRR